MWSSIVTAIALARLAAPPRRIEIGKCSAIVTGPQHSIGIREEPQHKWIQDRHDYSTDKEPDVGSSEHG
jgi:hypothetical protein